MGLFTGSSELKDVRTPEQKAAQAFQSNLLKGGSPTVPTEQVAGMSSAEQLAQQILGGYGTSTPEGLDVIREAANAPSDITQDPTIQALMKQLDERGARESNRLARSITLKGQQGGVGADMLGQKQRDIDSNYLATLAPYAMQSRQQKMSAAEILASLGESSTLNRLNALSTTGSLPRQLEQLQNTANYQKLMQQILFPYQYQAPVAGSLSNSQGYALEQTPSMFEQAGPLIQAAGLAAVAMSDVRLKENIKPVTNAIDKIKKIAAYTYNFKGSDKECIGLIAQEVEKVMPQATREIGGIKMVDLYAVQSLLIQGIKELSEA